MLVWMVAFWVLVVALAVAVVSWLFPKDGAVAQARRLLRERLARGEITAAEYREGVRALSSSGKAERGLAPVLALLLLALLTLVLLGMGSGWGMHGSRWMGGMGGMPMPHMSGWDRRAGPPPSSRPGGRLVPVVLVDFGFRPRELRVRAGEVVNLKLRNSGQILHDLYVPALGFRVTVPPGQEVVAGLPEVSPGSYEFYCTLPGHREAGMRGTLVVEL
jgi:heme/copper-type cytochrome/quinol oxidase subunit 2